MKKAYPELGDNLQQGTHFPVDLKTSHAEYEESIAKSEPERAQEYRQSQARLLRLTGAQRMRDLMGRSDDQEFVEEIRASILGNLADDETAAEREGMLNEARGLAERIRLKISFALEDMLDRIISSRRLEKLEVMGADLQHYCREADELISHVIKSFFPELSSGISMTNDIRDNHDPAYLLSIAMDDGWDKKARFEAKRKLVLMELMANVDRVVSEEKKSGNDLAFFHDLMNRHIYSHEGKKRGAHKERLLVARHGGENFRNINWSLEDIGGQDISDTASEDPNVIKMPMGFRSFRVGENGHNREIEFMVDSRHKEKNSLALKLLRKDTKNPEDLLGDLNGVRLVFHNEDHIDLFEMVMGQRLRSAGYKIDFTRSKSAVGVDGALSCRKYNVNISNGDSKLHHYELQIFTIPEYLNYQYSTPHSWDEYEVTRFFESSSSEALFPSSIYKKLATVRQDVAAQAQERVRRQPKAAQNAPLSILPAEADETDQHQSEAQQLS